MELDRFVFGKRGAFFSTDALIALIIILSVLLVSFPVSNYVKPKVDIHSDILYSLSTLKVGEVDNAYVRSLIASGQVRDENKNLLEQIGEFYVRNLTLAREVANEVLGELDTKENIGIWYGDDLIFSNNKTPYASVRDVDVVRQIVSGVEVGQNITGFSARAFLSSDMRTDYHYFGGYVGDGNISLLVDYSGNISDEGRMELVIVSSTGAGTFDFYVNNVSVGNFATSPSPDEPVSYPFSTVNFASGDNILEFKGENLYIAGGYVKVSYRSDVEFGTDNQTYYFPGIDGLINLYDSFYIPNDLQSMDVSLHMDTNYTVFLNFGNVTVFSGTTNGEETLNFSNATLSGILDYGSFEGENIPLRLGLLNASYLGITKDIDVFSVTDLSGSMDDNCDGCNEITCAEAECRDYTDPVNPGCGICDAKDANYLLVDMILNTTGNRVGLVGYDSIADPNFYHPLSIDDVSLKAEAATWDASGSTCICCGVDKAIEGFLEGVSRDLIYYKFDGDILDFSGSGNDGTVTGSPGYVSGLNNSALEFNGIDEYVSSGDVGYSDNGTIAFWFKLKEDFDSSVPVTQGLWSKYIDGDNDAFIALKGGDMGGGSGSDGLIQVKLEDPSGATYVATTTNSWIADTWYHFALVWNPGAVRVYVDGIGENSASGSRIISYVADNDFGRSEFEAFNMDGPRYLNGSLDEVRVYSRALSSSEISDLADNTPSCGNDNVEVGEACEGTGNVSCIGGGFVGVKECGSCEYVRDCAEDDIFRSMVVMSDGQATRGCTGDYADSVDAQEAIDKSLVACSNYGIVVHSIGFGADVDNVTLLAIADNGCCGGYYYSTATNLSDVYQQVATSILTEYTEQTIIASGGAALTTVYPDSKIDFVYSKPDVSYGLVMTLERGFDDAFGGSFEVPAGAIPISTNIVSYSGPLWTTGVEINGNTLLNLSEYGEDYLFLGDPYQVTDMDSIVIPGAVNYANVTTGVSSDNSSQPGSSYNKIIYVIAKNASSYSSIKPIASGCNWSIQVEDNSTVDVGVPFDYSGSDYCYYNMTTDVLDPIGEWGAIENQNDAFQLAALDLLQQLDLDSNGKVDILFTDQDLQITLSEIEGIPFSYYTEVQVRRWV